MNSNSVKGAISASYSIRRPATAYRPRRRRRVSSNASHIRSATIRFSAVSTSAVAPHATGPRASSSVSGKWSRTSSMSCSAASTVRPSPCQRFTSASRSAEVLVSMALNGSSSTIRRASCSSTRANSMRCIWPPDSVPIERFSNPLRPTAASALVILSRSALPMPPKNPVVRHRPVPTRSNTEIGKLRSMSTLCGR